MTLTVILTGVMWTLAATGADLALIKFYLISAGVLALLQINQLRDRRFDSWLTGAAHQGIGGGCCLLVGERVHAAFARFARAGSLRFARNDGCGNVCVLAKCRTCGVG
jgi:hypothetical protein